MTMTMMYKHCPLVHATPVSRVLVKILDITGSISKRKRLVCCFKAKKWRMSTVVWTPATILLLSESQVREPWPSN